VAKKKNEQPSEESNEQLGLVIGEDAVEEDEATDDEIAVSVDTGRESAPSDIEGLEDKAPELEAPPVGINLSTNHKVYSVAMILDMFRTGRFRLPTFQRKFVWSKKKRQGFLNSLIVGVPMTSLMVAVDPDTYDRFILDGFQRIRTMDLFMSDKEKLDSGIPQIAKQKYSKLPHEVKNKILNTEFVIIEVTSDRQFWPYTFGQINKGGVSLNPTEIRRATFQHPAMLALDDFTESTQLWIELFGKNFRYRGLQAALRGLAMHMGYRDYKKPINQYMTTFCQEKLAGVDGAEVKLKFELVTQALYLGVGPLAFRVAEGRGVNLGLIDCMIHAGLSIVEAKWDVDAEVLGDLLKQIRDTLLREQSTCFSADTSSVESVMTRMQATDDLIVEAIKIVKEDA